MAAARGCSLPFSRLAANERSCFSSISPAVTTVFNFGFPSVKVPVLSTTRVSILRMVSMASAFLKSTPIVAPLPVATIMDMGVARPRAHGHAMISTETAAMSPWARRGSGPARYQMRKEIKEIRMTAGTKYPATTSASLWIGALLL